MQAIEFEAVAHNRLIRVPDEVLDGTTMRVLLLFDELKTTQPVKNILSSMSNVGLDEDVERSGVSLLNPFEEN